MPTTAPEKPSHISSLSWTHCKWSQTREKAKALVIKTRTLTDLKLSSSCQHRLWWPRYTTTCKVMLTSMKVVISGNLTLGFATVGQWPRGILLWEWRKKYQITLTCRPLISHNLSGLYLMSATRSSTIKLTSFSSFSRPSPKRKKPHPPM